MLEQGRLIPNELTYVKGGLMGERVLPPEIVPALHILMKRWKDPETMTRFLQVWDAFSRWSHLRDITRIFKVGVTALWPAHHMLNSVGNVWANLIAGVVDPREYKMALDVMYDAIRGGGKKRFTFGSWTGTSDEFMHLGIQRNIMGFGGGSFTEEDLRRARDLVRRGKGFFESPIPQKPLRIFGKTIPIPAKVRAGIKEIGIPALSAIPTGGLPLAIGPTLGRNVGLTLESWHKMTHFISKIRAGHTLDTAALSVKQYLFDYSALSKIEKVFLKDIVPFWTWTRFNVPLMMKSLATRPGILSNTQHVLTAIERAMDPSASPVDRTLLPDWMKNRLVALMSTGEGAPMYTAFLMPGVGLDDFSQLMSEGLDGLIDRLNPVIKASSVLTAEAVRAATGEEVEYDVQSRIAPAIFHRFPEPFKDWLGFHAEHDRAGQVKYFVANPRKLQMLMALASPTSRFQTTLSAVLEKTPTQIQNPLTRALLGAQVRKVSPQDMAITILGGVTDKLSSRLGELSRQHFAIYRDRSGVRGGFRRLPDGTLKRKEDIVREGRDIARELMRLRRLMGKLGVENRRLRFESLLERNPDAYRFLEALGFTGKEK
jgi:hypothetical protein